MIHHFLSKRVKRLINNKIINYFFNLSPTLSTQMSSRSTHWMKILIPHPMSTHVAYFWWTMLQKKWEIHEKTWLQSHFSCIYNFSCSRIHRKYEKWVLLRWGIKVCIQRVLPLEFWVKTLGDKLKIFFFIFSL